MSFDLTNLHISESFQSLVQSSGSALVNGLGELVKDFNDLSFKNTITEFELVNTSSLNSDGNIPFAGMHYTSSIFPVKEAAAGLAITPGVICINTIITESEESQFLLSNDYGNETQAYVLNQSGSSITGIRVNNMGVRTFGTDEISEHLIASNSNGDYLLELYNNGDYIQTNISSSIYTFNQHASVLQGIAGAGTFAESTLLNVQIASAVTNNDDYPAAVSVVHDSNTSNNAFTVTRYNPNTGQVSAGFLCSVYGQGDVGLTVKEDGIYTQGLDSNSGSVHLQSTNWNDDTIFEIRNNGYIILPQVSASFNYVDDTAAAAANVPLGGLYHTNGAVKIRLV